ncbi:MAG: hypothetical protein GVY36_02110 [Verrucomicrobia bacterium]|nr:hypothetical protein [Verrucomicrobiota bacterium]
MLQAGVVVDLNFDETGGTQDTTRALTTDTSTVKAVDWDDSTYLFTNDARGQNWGVYGGVYGSQIDGEVTGYNALQQRNFGTGHTRIELAHLATDADPGGPTELNVLLLWDQADFLSGDRAWDNSASSSFAFNGILNRSGGAFRFVIRDGSDYYLSNLGRDNTGFYNGAISLAGDTAGLEWASFNPTLFADFDANATNLGISASTFTEQTFSDVTGVGFIFDGFKENVGQSVTRLEVQSFEVSLIPEPSAFAFLAGLGVLGLTAVRRRR